MTETRPRKLFRLEVRNCKEFDELSAEATAISFLGVLSGPRVRSSYRARRHYRQARKSRASNDQHVGAVGSG